LRYVLDFGSANAGSAPTFGTFKNADTLADIAAPSIVEIGSGLFYFDYSWSSPSISSIVYQASVAGVELSDVISSDQVTTGAVSAGTGAGINSWLWTAGQVLNMAATEVGLSEASDPYSSTNAVFVQLRSMLKMAGMELCQARDWLVLVKEATLTGDAATTTFALPSDFLRMKEESGFDRGTSWAFRGPTSSKEWQRLKASGTIPTLQPLYRVQQGRMVFYEAPAVGTLAYEYVSRYWVASDGAASADSYFPAASGDKVLFDPLMLVRIVKSKFRVAKGFESQADYDETFRQAVESAAGLDPAPVLSLGGSPSGERFIDTDNLPERVTL
jgi:hypothetical protein